MRLRRLFLLPEGGEVEKGLLSPTTTRDVSESEAAVLENLASSEKDAEAEATSSALLLQPSPRSKRKREAVDSGTSKAGRTQQDYELASPEDNPLLDALSLVEIHGDEAREGLAEASMGLSRLFPYFFKKKELIFDNYTPPPRPSEVFPASSHLKKTPVAAELIEDSSSKSLTQDFEELRQQLQSTKKQSLMIMEQSRKSSEREKTALQQAQDAIAEKETAVAEAAAASARENFMLQLLMDASLDMEDVGQIVPKCLAKMAKRRKNFSKYDDIVAPVAEDMMDELLRMDAEFFVKGNYAEHSTHAINNERLTIDNILGNH
ncbi:hypothetical protein QYE76_025808 [Lolium multiflorum]|uniref:Uncharacterized protein n=1 Tax=Lolium multiflorum TaxID=4521 RepID=A0AAD8RGG8_LOLMU|nr:hypothetical protein QYE76_025808 [Lolium multiflorum]